MVSADREGFNPTKNKQQTLSLTPIWLIPTGTTVAKLAPGLSYVGWVPDAGPSCLGSGNKYIFFRYPAKPVVEMLELRNA